MLYNCSCPPFQHLLSERLTSLGIMGHPRVPPLNPSDDSAQNTPVPPQLSMKLRAVHTILVQDYGLPEWGSYVIFALATILTGALIGGCT